MATYAIVYGTVSKMIRRVIADDDGMTSIGTMPDGVTPAVRCTHYNKATSYFPLAPGESAIVRIPPNVTTPAKWQDWVNAVRIATGVTPPVINCALVDPDTNMVMKIIVADPTIDAAPEGFTMVQCYSPKIGVGCTYDPGTGKFWAPGGNIPPGAPGNKGGSTAIVVPPEMI